jgi:hypothetical protein
MPIPYRFYFKYTPAYGVGNNMANPHEPPSQKHTWVEMENHNDPTYDWQFRRNDGITFLAAERLESVHELTTTP